MHTSAAAYLQLVGIRTQCNDGRSDLVIDNGGDLYAINGPVIGIMQGHADRTLSTEENYMAGARRLPALPAVARSPSPIALSQAAVRLSPPPNPCDAAHSSATAKHIVRHPILQAHHHRHLDADPSIYGQPITFSVKVSGGTPGFFLTGTLLLVGPFGDTIRVSLVSLLDRARHRNDPRHP